MRLAQGTMAMYERVNMRVCRSSIVSSKHKNQLLALHSAQHIASTGQGHHNLHLTAKAAGTIGHKMLQSKLALHDERKAILRNCHGWMPRRPLSPAGLILTPAADTIFSFSCRLRLYSL
jgi:hypothetical protein